MKFRQNLNKIQHFLENYVVLEMKRDQNYDILWGIIQYAKFNPCKVNFISALYRCSNVTFQNSERDRSIIGWKKGAGGGTNQQEQTGAISLFQVQPIPTKQRPGPAAIFSLTGDQVTFIIHLGSLCHLSCTTLTV